MRSLTSVIEEEIESVRLSDELIGCLLDRVKGHEIQRQEGNRCVWGSRFDVFNGSLCLRLRPSGKIDVLGIMLHKLQYGRFPQSSISCECVNEINPEDVQSSVYSPPVTRITLPERSGMSCSGL
jgi:hypothetical protein